MAVDHWMMFSTFAEQRHFVYPSPATYGGVIFNANMAAHAPDGLAAFLIEMTPGMHYVVDPLTHAFQHDPAVIKNDDNEVKSSIRRLCEAYGEPVKSLAGKSPLLPRTFADEAVLRGFVDRCLTFQESHLANAIKKVEAFKYLDDDDANVAPYALVAPYFFMSETTLQEWLPICVRTAVVARELRPNSKLFASVVIDQGLLLDDNGREKLIESMAALNVSGFLLWIDGLDEHEAGIAELRALVSLARGLRKNGTREVLNLHGGYFSILAAGTLGNGAMSAVAHGPEFGEHRAVVPVGGGIPIARYYIPQLHARIKYREAVDIFKNQGWLESAQAFHQNVCNCAECQRVIEGNANNFLRFGESQVIEVKRRGGLTRMDYPTTQTKERCLKHYLERKAMEYKLASEATPDRLITDLREGRNRFVEILGLEGVAYLSRWETALTIV